jgi:3',5'-cyclic AMP phosphodiesterase CpdA
MFVKSKRDWFGAILMRSVCVICIVATVMGGGCAMKRANFMYGMLADVQYADRDAKGARHYRESINVLADSANFFNSKEMIDNASYIGYARKPSFVVHLGDIIEGGPDAAAEMDEVVSVFNRIKAKKYFVLGNHDFVGLDRDTVYKKLGLKRGYYDFSKGKWRFVMLDTMDISIAGGWEQTSRNYLIGRQMFDELVEEKAANAHDWNGGVGSEQIIWLKKVLDDAEKRRQKVVLFAHHPVVPAGAPDIAWNSDVLLNILRSYDCVFAYFNGHRHVSDYYYEDGIYFVTIQGMVESPDRRVYALVWVYDDRVEVESTGKVKRLMLRFDER